LTQDIGAAGLGRAAPGSIRLSEPGTMAVEHEAPSAAQAPELDPRLAGYRRSAYAVWEITLKCNLACSHCGSRAGEARQDELSTEEALDLIRQMAELGITEVTLIGGEAYLRPDWLQLVRAIDQAGMVPTMVTGGYGISLETARKMKQAGLAQVSVSIDGLEATHDRLRGKLGSWQACFRTLGHFREAGLPFGFNTQINRLSAPEIPRLYELVSAAGARAWQFSLTVPMGNAADHPEILIQPAEIDDLYAMLARVVHRATSEGMIVLPGNDIGYYGPYEDVLRYNHHQMNMAWQGCQAGMAGLGIEADGKIKGCPSLPTDEYVGGNIRDLRLAQIVETRELTFAAGGGTPQGTAHLWGFCRTCEYAEICRGGCTWTAHVFFDRRGNNPHCHHRALELARRGIRERVQLKLAAIGEPFDNGVFALIEEPLDAPWPDWDTLHFTADKVVWPPSWEAWPSF
jgi:nif11-class peptide radical SAM maturase 3